MISWYIIWKNISKTGQKAGYLMDIIFADSINCENLEYKSKHVRYITDEIIDQGI